MSIYVMLSFDDDEDAKDFVKYTIDNNIVLEDSKYQEFPTEIAANVEAVIKKPAKFCQCTGRRSGFTRGKSFGWWVCADCGSPTELWASKGSWAYFMGLNLLPPEISTELRPKGWERSKFTWDFLLDKPSTAGVNSE